MYRCPRSLFLPPSEPPGNKTGGVILKLGSTTRFYLLTLLGCLKYLVVKKRGKTEIAFTNDLTDFHEETLVCDL